MDKPCARRWPSLDNKGSAGLADIAMSPGRAVRRRLRRAAHLFRAVLRCDPLDAAACLSLASVMSAAGRAAEEKALLRRAVGMSRGPLTLGDRFKALMKLRRYKEAVATEERILDENPGLPDIRGFWDPWDWDERVSREERRRELRAFERALGPKPRGPWLHYYRGSLSGPEDLENFNLLAGYPAKRYGWMYFKAGSAALTAANFEQAATWFKRALAGRPVDWRAHCFLAETYLCLRKSAAAFAEMDRPAAAPRARKGHCSPGAPTALARRWQAVVRGQGRLPRGAMRVLLEGRGPPEARQAGRGARRARSHLGAVSSRFRGVCLARRSQAGTRAVPGGAEGSR